MGWLVDLFVAWAMANERARAEIERKRAIEVKAKSDALRDELEASDRRKRGLS
jgi:hypothetical protein